MHRARGRSVATAATDAHAAAVLWNPHSTQVIKVVEIGIAASAAPSAGATPRLRRTSTRGTAGSTVTPTIENDTRRRIAAPSGALLDLATYSAQPTMAGDLFGWVLAAVAASGLLLPLGSPGIEVPPGTGLAIVTAGAIAIPASDISFAWLEDW